MHALVRFFTDTATLAIFDPARLKARVDDDSGWWCSDDFSQIAEVQSGAAAIVSIGADGVYELRITDGPLTADERDYAAEVVQELGLEVVDGQLFIGPGECLPGGGAAFTAEDVDRGALVAVANGRYFLDVYAIHWFDSPRWWREDHRPPDDSPPDFVVVIRPRSTAFGRVTTQPQLTGCADEFLFASSTRQVGPQPGMTLTTVVRKNVSGELSLKNCGPRAYRASLTDYSQVAWKDTVRFRVVRVDHETRTLIGEFLERI